jgi:hypothetical protein
MDRSDLADLLDALEAYAEEEDEEGSLTLQHLLRWRRIVEMHRDDPARLVELLASVYLAGVRAGRERAREDEDSRWLGRQGVVR